jgi:hypothetical protein
MEWQYITAVKSFITFHQIQSLMELTVKMKMTVRRVKGMMILAMMAAALVHRYLIHIPNVTGATRLEDKLIGLARK